VLPAARPVTSDTSVPLHGHGLKLHLSTPPNRTPVAAAAIPVLLVYATGDAGWWGKDREIFTRLRAWGYPAVGFSAREYVHHLGKDAVAPQQIAEDFAAIVRAAESALGLPAPTRAVLVGKSRGAGLAVAAAGRFPMKPGLAGVLAVGLTREEEYVYRHFRRSPQPVMLQTYGYLPRLGSLPVAVIQSTRDNYVPADEARRLFGPDTASRELVPIDSRNHNFDGALDLLYDEMERSIQWIVQR
jgi:fermentation-respiration switch protein FrsA (DUF1100 family)